MTRTTDKRIVLVSGPVREADRRGHHDYRAGCALLADLLRRVPGIAPQVAENGWPGDSTTFDDAAAVLFYDNGAGKQGFLQSEARRRKLDELSERGCGVVMLHQAVGFPPDQAERGKAWVGGVYLAGQSRRGHWRSRHENFPRHPATRGVSSWSIRDGWLSAIRFHDNMQAITPLLWSGRQQGGSPTGGIEDVVSWAYAPDGRGRAFVFTGLDSHSAWTHAGLRRLIANGLLWSAGHPIPEDPHWVDMPASAIDAYCTPRRSPVLRALRSLGRKVRRARRGERKW